MSSIEKIINELKTNIESRRDIVKFSKENYLINNLNNEDNLTISKSNFEDILLEFDFTITQSLQAIKTLEAEISNLKETINNSNKQKARNEVRSKKESLNDETDFKIVSPAYKCDNISYNTILEDKKNCIAKDHNHKFENFDTNNSEHHYINNDNILEEDKESKLDLSKLSYPMLEHVQDKNLIYHKTKNIQKANIDNINLNYVKFAQGLNLNFDYSGIKNLKSLLNLHTSNDLTKGQGEEDSKRNPKESPRKFNALQYDNNLLNSQSLNREFTFNNIKPEQENKSSKRNFNKVKDIDLKMESFRPQRYSNIDESKGKSTLGSFNLSELKVVDNNYYNNEHIRDDNITKFDLNLPFQNKIYVKTGLRQKLKSRTNSATASQCSSRANSKMNTIDYNKADNNFQNNNIQFIEKKGYLGIVETESDHTIPFIHSKKNAFKNRINENEKDKIITILLKRINRANGMRQHLACKYGKGSYDTFIKKLKNLELNLEDIEEDFKYINNKKEKKTLKRGGSVKNIHN